MNDTIYRQAAIEAFDGVKVDEQDCTEYDIGYNDGIDFAVSRLSVLPSAQPEPQWIPFAEHRPWEGQQILACSEDGVMWMTVFRSCIGFSGAWLPLPEPYKGEP